MNPIGSSKYVHHYIKIETRYGVSLLSIILISSRKESEDEDGSERRSEK